MINKEILKKKLIYRSTNRGSKEMDILLGEFVKKHINQFDNQDLSNLMELLSFEDEILNQWYFYKKFNNLIPKNKVSKMLSDFIIPI